ncbi:tyrosine kinase receptor Cad96Ca-like [Lingula anatina]|uniref:Tyrosine kinase receptor Cad96Ca-like n=1 Tax=Lingula anatina TaxID=7574 RepID=A0A2R2MP52_LINAN|nr:tyrosine kinase receptor Cad96Ca-like [Lingula anatina]|eukprot:XP_023932011.1 tyrosine kinase receptor Cad96Ca-like [Lingula anatina]
MYYAYRYYQARKRRRAPDHDPEDEELRRLEPPVHDAGNPAGTENTSSETGAGEISIQELQFDRSCKLGEGQFGEVWKGYMEVEEKVKTVAVKILKGNTMFKEKEDFKTEMETLKNVPAHKNIVPLIATSSKEDPLFIVMEYQTMGSLQRVLRNGRGNTYYSNTYGCSKFTAQQLLTFAYEVACGMTHIAELGYLHRDLATRNVLVDEHFTCKISDFGLARDVSLIREYESRSQYLCKGSFSESPRLLHYLAISLSANPLNWI